MRRDAAPSCARRWRASARPAERGEPDFFCLFVWRGGVMTPFCKSPNPTFPSLLAVYFTARFCHAQLAVVLYVLLDIAEFAPVAKGHT